MALAVTERATEALKELLGQQPRDPEQVLRLVSDSEGNLNLALDSEKTGDQVVEHDGDMVMVIDSSLSEVLTGNILDMEDTPTGARFTLYR